MADARILSALACLGWLLTPPAAAASTADDVARFAIRYALPVALSATVLALFAVLVGSMRVLRRFLRGRRAYRDARFERVVILGFDGMDPELAAGWMRQGKLAHLARMARIGTFRPLASTHPPACPVAWSTFLTGVNPAKHNIYDIRNRDLRSYLPYLSTARALEPRGRPSRRAAPLGPPRMKLLRKSKPFWHHLSEAGVFSSIMRVPVTFPPEPFSGDLLCGMAVPDLHGSQGTYSFFSSREGTSGQREGGVLFQLIQEGDAWLGELPGPENPHSEEGRLDLTLPLRIRPDTSRRRAEVNIDGRRISLRQGEYSDWIPVRFRAGLQSSAQGICRMYLKSVQPEVELYVTPVQIDPRRPAAPISHPPEYGADLAARQGPFSTLGWAEDTWALHHGALDDHAFLDQCYRIHAEREQMFFDALEKTRRGVCICVFDITDRVQHMFWRHMEPGHPAAPKNEPADSTVIEKLYERMDALVGRVLDVAGPDALVLVVSDHGFKSFRRGFNLNAWLHREGYLALVSGSTVSEPSFRHVDWQRTRAYGLGWNGLYLNLAGRERFGIVQPGADADALLTELRGKLRGIADPIGGQPAIREVFDTREVYSGPYQENAPDLLIGYAPGYRAAWESVNGSVMGEVFQDNTRPWSGDHCTDPRDVPGVLFANRPVLGDHPSIADVAPTVLQLFGLAVPRYMDGNPWTVRTEPAPLPTGAVAAAAPRGF